MNFDLMRLIFTSKDLQFQIRPFCRCYTKVTSKFKLIKTSDFLVFIDYYRVDGKCECRCSRPDNVNTQQMLVSKYVYGNKVLAFHIAIKEHQVVSGLNLALQAQYNEAIDEAIYGSDEFRMYAYKIKRCTRMRSHDWTECPYAHRGEKAQRRDPRKIPYTGIACPAFRNGKCRKGDACEYAHGIFEYWLHPDRYRTRACNAGRFCQRKVCFFAHTPSQLRECKNNCLFTYKGTMMNAEDHDHDDHHQVMAVGGTTPSGGESGEGSTEEHQPHHVVVEPISSNNDNNKGNFSSVMDREGVSELLKRLKELKMREDEERERKNIEDLDLPQLGWVSELVK